MAVDTGPPWVPRVVSMQVMLTRPLFVNGGVGTVAGWHRHDFDEICLVSEEGTQIGHAGARLSIPAETLLLFRQGEDHGYWNGPRDHGRFWVIHYHADPRLAEDCPRLTSPDPADRIWHLDSAVSTQIKSLFLKVMGERREGRVAAVAAESAWLRLLLIALARHGCPDGVSTIPLPQSLDPDLIALWQLVNEHAASPDSLNRTLNRSVANYDALRHRFRRAFGAAPRELLQSLRMERAKTLLLETSGSIRDIADSIGYGRQHEFSRAFHRQVGMSPTEWRAHPP